MHGRCVLALAVVIVAIPFEAQSFAERLTSAAIERTSHIVRYDGAYVDIPYPGGDVPPGTGVCTDLVVRTYRALGVDLQKELHEDMLRAFSDYPQRWGLPRPDSNIDHRRVPNLRTFFTRHGSSLAVTDDPSAYSPGDLVTWDLGGGVPHIGIVVERTSPDGQRHLIVHNISAGPRLEDVLFAWTITGHYRYEVE